MDQEDLSITRIQNRAFGILFIISPLGNLFLTLWQKRIGMAYTFSNLWKVATQLHPAIWIVFFANVAAGLWLFLSDQKKSRYAERLAMMALVLNFFQNINTLSEDVKAGKSQAPIPIITNIAIFTWFYFDASVRLDSMVRSLLERFRVKFGAQLKRHLTPRPQEFKLPLSPGIPLQIASQAPWARIIEISQRGLRIRPNEGASIPSGTEGRVIEFTLDPEFSIRAVFSSRTHQELVFRFLGGELLPKERIVNWARRIQTAK